MPKAVAFLAALAVGFAPAWSRCRGECPPPAPASVVCEHPSQLAPACAQGSAPCDSRPGMTAVAGDETRRSMAPQTPWAVTVAPLAAARLEARPWRHDDAILIAPLEHRPRRSVLRI